MINHEISAWVGNIGIFHAGCLAGMQHMPHYIRHQLGGHILQLQALQTKSNFSQTLLHSTSKFIQYQYFETNSFWVQEATNVVTLSQWGWNLQVSDVSCKNCWGGIKQLSTFNNRNKYSHGVEYLAE
jgi:hypothetical protein